MPGAHGKRPHHARRGRRPRHAPALVLAATVVALPAGPAALAAPAPVAVERPSAGSVRQAVDQVIRLVNGERAAHGCPRVRWNAALQRAAQRHADDMAARRFFGHTNPDGADPGARITAAGYSWSAYGENIAVGRPTPAAVMKDWMNSPGHRRNTLQCDLKDIGVGIRAGTGGPWWTQDFAARGD
ncbi:CAP domain-containing protein [Streptomyces bugieae]|uniref:CAP domain-containing protein n=1 Tax=Streptomyces bugieae TaxID=3098223 RepID=UPI003B001E7A